MENLENLTTDELSNLMDEKNKAINAQNDALEIVYAEKYNLELRLMELAETLRKGKKLVAKYKIEHEIIKNLFFGKRRT